MRKAEDVEQRKKVGLETLLKKDGETLEKQIDSNVDSKYNSTLTPPRQTYLKSVNEGWITPLISFDEYIDIYNQISGSLIGKTTVNGIAISEISAHFMERVIGTSVDPKIHKEEHKKVARSGVRIEDITYALLYGEARRPKKTTNGYSQLFVGKNCVASINPQSGRLIQCNPIGGKNGEHQTQ